MGLAREPLTAPGGCAPSASFFRGGLQRSAATVDGSSVRRTRSAHRRYSTRRRHARAQGARVHAVVHRMVRCLGPYEADGGRRYLELGRRVAEFLTEAGHGPDAWTELDGAALVGRLAQAPEEAIEICCNLSAMLPWLIMEQVLSAAEAGRIWRGLQTVCPDEPWAHEYLRSGLEQFGTAGSN